MTCYPCQLPAFVKVRKEMIRDPKRVIAIAIDYFGIPERNLVSKRRYRNAVEARMIIADYLMRECGLTSIAVGRIFNRDHSSILHNKKTLSNLLKVDKNINEKTKGFLLRLEDNFSDERVKAGTNVTKVLN